MSFCAIRLRPRFGAGKNSRVSLLRLFPILLLQISRESLAVEARLETTAEDPVGELREGMRIATTI